MKRSTFPATILCACHAVTAFADGVKYFGDVDLMGQGSYPGDPTTDVTLVGLAPGVVSSGPVYIHHTYPFTPEADDHFGTDQIYVGSNQIGFADGYSLTVERLAGPQVIVMDYSALVGPGEVITSLTLGIGADDFEFGRWGNPFTAMLNGVAAPELTTFLNSLLQTGPFAQFSSVGISPSILISGHTLTLEIDQGGFGNDGWAIDFLTIGVTTVPSPASGCLLLLMTAIGHRKRR